MDKNQIIDEPISQAQVLLDDIGQSTQREKVLEEKIQELEDEHSLWRVKKLDQKKNENAILRKLTKDREYEGANEIMRRIETVVKNQVKEIDSYLGTVQANQTNQAMLQEETYFDDQEENKDEIYDAAL